MDNKKIDIGFTSFEDGIKINIPDEFEATIEDKKIILKRKESEDEKIRKELIAIFKGEIPYTSEENNKRYIAWLEKQCKKPKKVSIWKHWKDGIAGGAEGEQIFLVKIGRIYSISSCLGCECDYIELSELNKL